MSIIRDEIQYRKAREAGLGPTKEELQSHHRYQNDLLADGFVSPIVLPCDRIKELMGEMSVSEMADFCHMPTRDLQVLIENDFLEPNGRQLMSIAFAFGVSVLWLLGYHTRKDGSLLGSDREMLAIISKRNGAEANLARIKANGLLRDFFISVVKKRVNKCNLQIAATAARIIATEHLPLSEDELYILNGQPVFIEYVDDTAEWGLVLSDGTIKTDSGTLDIEATGTNYRAYQTPNTAVNFSEVRV